MDLNLVELLESVDSLTNEETIDASIDSKAAAEVEFSLIQTLCPGSATAALIDILPDPCDISLLSVDPAETFDFALAYDTGGLFEDELLTTFDTISGAADDSSNSGVGTTSAAVDSNTIDSKINSDQTRSRPRRRSEMERLERFGWEKLDAGIEPNQQKRPRFFYVSPDGNRVTSLKKAMACIRSAS